MAPPTIHFTVGLGVEIILIMEEDHERLQRITETFETMSVTKVKVLTAFSEYPILRPIKYTSRLIRSNPIP